MDEEQKMIQEALDLVGLLQPYAQIASLSLLQQPGWVEGHKRKAGEDPAARETLLVNSTLQCLAPLLLPFLNCQTSSINLR